MQKQSFYSSIKAREKAKGNLVEQISKMTNLEGVDQANFNHQQSQNKRYDKRLENSNMKQNPSDQDMDDFFSMKSITKPRAGLIDMELKHDGQGCFKSNE